MRADGRQFDQLRNISFEPNIAAHATGSVLASFGNTRVICGATIEKKVPKWMRDQKIDGGWISAEYSMLPYSTLSRKQRDSSRGKLDGRSVEIQRLIGRSMRSVINLKRLPNMTLWLDCDVLQADGGTRTTAISGAYVAAQLAFQKLMATGALKENPLTDSVAAVSVGIVKNKAYLDLNYLEDRDARVDFNIVMTGSGQFVEVQGTGEEATFSQDELDQLIQLAAKGIKTINELQQQTI